MTRTAPEVLDSSAVGRGWPKELRSPDVRPQPLLTIAEPKSAVELNHLQMFVASPPGFKALGSA
eukprot:4300135-Prymnesium_polylepis.2